MVPESLYLFHQYGSAHGYRVSRIEVQRRQPDGSDQSVPPPPLARIFALSPDL